MSEDLEDLIDSEASKAASMSSDAGSISRRPIKDLIEADQYLAAKRSAASGNPFFGCRVRQAVPGSPGE